MTKTRLGFTTGPALAWPAVAPGPRATVPRMGRSLLQSKLLARLALGALVLAAGWVAVGAADGSYLLNTAGAPTPEWAYGPLHGLSRALGGLGPDSWSAGLLAMLVGYVVVLTTCGRIGARTAWAAILTTNALFLLTPSLVSTDVFAYVAYARLAVLHGLNPYLSAPAAVPHDAILPLVYWKHATTPYGPVFTLATYPLAGVSAWVAVWSLKLLAAVASLALTLIVWRSAQRRRQNPVRAALLVGLNPVLLIYAVSGAHNDLEGALLVALGVSLARGRREGASAGALVAAVSVKVTLGLALPFLLVGSRRPRRVVIGALLAGAVLVAGTLALFGPHVLDQLRRISADPTFDISGSGPDVLGRLLGTGIDGTLRAVCVTAAALATAVALIRVRRGADWVACAGWAAMALMLAIASFAPWYIVWLLPLAALGRSRRLGAATVALTAYILAVHLPILGGVPWLSGPG